MSPRSEVIPLCRVGCSLEVELGCAAETPPGCQRSASAWPCRPASLGLCLAGRAGLQGPVMASARPRYGYRPARLRLGTRISAAVAAGPRGRVSG